jgi:hypothetical protein
VSATKADHFDLVGDSLVYIQVANREEFDRLALPVREIHNGGSHGFAKSVHGVPGSIPGKPITIVFQHWVTLEDHDTYFVRVTAERDAQRDQVGVGNSA